MKEISAKKPSNSISVPLQTISIPASPHLHSSPKHLITSCTIPRCSFPESHSKPHNHPPSSALSVCAVLQGASWMTHGDGCHSGPQVDLHPTAMVAARAGGPLALARWLMFLCLPCASVLLCDHGDEPFITQPKSMRCDRSIRLEGTISTTCQSQTSKRTTFNLRMPFLLHTYKSGVNKSLTLLPQTSKLLCRKPKVTRTNCLRLIRCFVAAILIKQTTYLPWKM